MPLDISIVPMKPKRGLKTDAEESAVRSFFEAGRSGDWSAATAAFKRAYDICSGEPEGASEDKSEGSEYRE